MSATVPAQSLFWQVYVKADLKVSAQEIREAIALGYKGFAVTVDAIRPGKRERDIRADIAVHEAETEGEVDETFARGPTVGRP